MPIVRRFAVPDLDEENRMLYRSDSEWNDANELRCLAIYKKLEEKNFPRGMQIDLCRDMSRITKLEAGNISAKVSNYKSVAGVNSKSNASRSTISMYEMYGQLSAADIEKKLREELS